MSEKKQTVNERRVCEREREREGRPEWEDVALCLSPCRCAAAATLQPAFFALRTHTLRVYSVNN